MNFSEFLKERKTLKNITTAKDHYADLGGQKILGISLRHFQQIEANKYPPSEKLFLVLFDKIKAKDRKQLIMAYFESVTRFQGGQADLLEYLDQYLAPQIDKDTKSIWEVNRQLMIYSEVQLNFLIAETEAMKFHRKLLLKDRLPKSQVTLSKKLLDKLEDLELIERKGNEILPSRTLYRVPSYENSSPRVVSVATNYILKHIDLYISKEGSKSQELGFAVQMVKPEIAEKILEQMRSLKKWIQGVASGDSSDQSLVPFLYVGFSKKLDERDL